MGLVAWISSQLVVLMLKSPVTIMCEYFSWFAISSRVLMLPELSGEVLGLR